MALKFGWLRPPSASPNSLNHGLQVHLWVDSISASKCNSKLAQSRPQRGIDLQCILTLDRSRPPSTSLRSHDQGVLRRWGSHGIRRELVRKSGSASRSIGRGWEYMKRYPAVRNHTYWVDLWMLGKSAWDQELGKTDCVFRIMRWCLYSPLLGPSQLSLYLRLCFPSISTCAPLASPCQSYLRWWWQTDYLTTMASKCISKFTQSVSPGAPPITPELCLQPD